MSIPQSFIDELIARSSIEDVVGSYVSLTRKGNNLWGLCPFHGEKTASFSVSPSKQMYYCFGCHKGGGPLRFIMEIEGLGYVDAIKFLAKRANLEVPETDVDSGYIERKKRLLALNKDAARYFHRMLMSSEGEKGRKYFENRKLTKNTIIKFGLGYSLDSWDGLIRAMAELGYQKSELLDAGLAVNNKNGHIYDRFRGRVMFPIIDLHDNVIGFGGRILESGEPKYLNSPESSIFNKRKNLFALNLARKTKTGRIILTEGYMDTISMYQAGFDCAVASLGTALTEEQATLLSKYTSEVVLSYDGDSAGINAAQRAIPILEKVGIKVKVLRVTGAKDPDEYIKTYGADAFARLIDQSENEIDYRMNQISAKYNLEDLAQKVEYSQEIAKLLSTLNNSVEREVYGRKAAEVAGITAEAMVSEIEKARKSRVRHEQKIQLRKDLTPAAQMQPINHAFRYQNIRSARAEEGILRLLMNDSTLFLYTKGLTKEQFSSDILWKFFSIIQERYRNGMDYSLPTLEDELSAEEMNHFARILFQPGTGGDGKQALDDYIKLIETEAIKRANLSDDEILLEAQRRFQKNKKFGG